MKKRLLSILFVLTLVLCTLPVHALEGDDFRAAEDLSAIGLVGKSADYQLSAGATRAQAVTILSRIAGVSGGAHPYSGVPAWADGAVGGVYSLGILSPVYPDAAFRADEFVTADEWCALLLGLLGQPTATEGAALHALRIGMISREYASPLTRGELFELTADALGYRPQTGVSLIARMQEKGLCSAAAPFCPEVLTAREVADRYMAAIACITTYESEEDYAKGDASRDASAFFISADGIAVTNYHSIDNAAAAAATLTTGEVFPVEGVLWANEEADLAVIRISRRSAEGIEVPAFATLTLAGSKAIRPGDVVYALGNPLGLGHSISSGIIGMTSCRSSLSSEGCIVTSASISSGSSGGALVNVLGHVVGVTAGSFTDGNDMYLSVPTDLLLQLDLSGLSAVPLKDLDTLS